MNNYCGIVAKRVMDVCAAVSLLLVLAPLFAVMSLIIKHTMGSPVIFKQMRPGFQGKPFVIYKYRTMTDARDSAGNLLPDEQRLTGMGSWMRKWSIDELPQLWNVLKGELSLVGPRPLLMEYLPRYSKEQARRHDVKPGITGWAQINGRNAICWEEKFKLDVWYVDNWSFWLDMKILLMTAIRVAASSGISNPGHATMPDFEGTKPEKRD